MNDQNSDSTVGSVAQWASRHGITRQAAYKRLKEHGIPFVSDGLLDFRRADEIFQLSTEPLRRALERSFDVVIDEFRMQLLGMGAELREPIFEADDQIQVQRIIDAYINRALSSVARFRRRDAA